MIMVALMRVQSGYAPLNGVRLLAPLQPALLGAPTAGYMDLRSGPIFRAIHN